MRVGIVSDTHGWFDPAVAEVLGRVDLILHAGDICGAEVLAALKKLAPVRAISGNNDRPPLSRDLPEWRTERLEGWRVLIVHDLGKPNAPRPPAARLLARERPEIVVSGHSHDGHALVEGGKLFLNPGGAGRKRFKLLRSVATLELNPEFARVQLLSLEPPLGRVVASASLQHESPGMQRTPGPSHKTSLSRR
jgi:putative phosphoesterase